VELGACAIHLELVEQLSFLGGVYAVAGDANGNTRKAELAKVVNFLQGLSIHRIEHSKIHRKKYHQVFCTCINYIRLSALILSMILS